MRFVSHDTSPRDWLQSGWILVTSCPSVEVGGVMNQLRAMRTAGSFPSWLFSIIVEPCDWTSALMNSGVLVQEDDFENNVWDSGLYRLLSIHLAVRYVFSLHPGSTCRLCFLDSVTSNLSVSCVENICKLNDFVSGLPNPVKCPMFIGGWMSSSWSSLSRMQCKTLERPSWLLNLANHANVFEKWPCVSVEVCHSAKPGTSPMHSLALGHWMFMDLTPSSAISAHCSWKEYADLRPSIGLLQKAIDLMVSGRVKEAFHSWQLLAADLHSGKQLFVAISNTPTASVVQMHGKQSPSFGISSYIPDHPFLQWSVRWLHDCRDLIAKLQIEYQLPTNRTIGNQLGNLQSVIQHLQKKSTWRTGSTGVTQFCAPKLHADTKQMIPFLQTCVEHHMQHAPCDHSILIFARHEDCSGMNLLVQTHVNWRCLIRILSKDGATSSELLSCVMLSPRT